MTLSTRAAVLFVASVLSVPEAGAQTSDSRNQLTLSYPSGLATAFNQADCEAGTKTYVSLDFAPPISATTTLKLFVTSASSCPDDKPGDQDSVLIDAREATAADHSLSQDVSASLLKQGGVCPADTTVTWRICAQARQPDPLDASKDKVVARVSLTLTYDSQPPAAPEIVSASGGDGAIYLRWSGEDVESWTIDYRTWGPAPTETVDLCSTGGLDDDGGMFRLDSGSAAPADAGADGGDGADAGVDAGAPSSSGGEFRSKEISDGTVRETSVTGLTNDQGYELYVVAVDVAGNMSADSAHVVATPRTVHDFYRRYRCEGGAEQGGFGCSAAGAAALPWAALLLAAAGARLGWRRLGRRP